MEPDNFDDVRAALAKATPGEWEQGVAGRAGVVVFDGDDVRPVAATTPANADFIALAHNRLPAILAALDDANARLAEAEGLLIGCLAAHHGDNAMSPEDWRNLARFLKESPDAQ